MRLLKQILIGFLIVLVFAALAGHFYLQNLKKGAIPDYNADVTLRNLQAEAEVFRDTFGIPHVYASNEADLYRAVGFAMAQDRLWQMDLLRRATQGRLSEIFGETLVNTDLLMRALRIPEKSEKILAGTSPEITSALTNFSEGVNSYIARYPLPPEFKILGYLPEPWEPVHSINLIGYMSWDLTSGLGTELLLNQVKNLAGEVKTAEMMADPAVHSTPVYNDFSRKPIVVDEVILSAAENLEKLGARVFCGSNNWAVSGAKSNTGKPLLANDMHLGLNAPGIWYQMQQCVEGKLNVTGLVLPGQPFVIAGHNDSIAWGMTNVMVDDLDFYAEKLNADTTQFFLDGQWKDLQIKKEIIKTKEGTDVEKLLWFTHRGPLVNQFRKGAETPVSIRWLGNEMSNEIRSVYLLNRAKNWSDFREAASTFVAVSQNIVYADTRGNIGLQCSAGVPIRKGNGIQVYPGDTSLYDWTGLVPFEELPFEFNPERGYVSSANNKTVPENYPYYISSWFAQPDRINRIREMLDEKETLGSDDFQKMQADVKSKKAESLTPVFLEYLKTHADYTELEKAAVNELEKWNFELTRESVASSVFEILYRRILENLVKDDLTPDLFKRVMGERMLLENLLENILKKESSPWIDDKNTTETEDLPQITVRSLKETVNELVSARGENPENWQWGKIHSFSLYHPLGSVKMLDKVLKLNRGPFEMHGSFHTVGPYSYSYNDLYNADHGASHRHIFDTGNWDKSLTVIPTGTSGIPASPFYLDQTGMYIHNRYHADPFSKPEVEKAAKFRMKFIPE